jgi:hypothetical protein
LFESADVLRAAMNRNAARRRFAIGFLFGLLAVVGPARARDEEPPGFPIDPEVATPRFELTEGRTLTTAGITLYVAGALYDLYTTKRAMDYGLHEANPLLGRTGDPDRTLATAAVAKVGFGFAIGGFSHRGSDRVRGTWFLTCGALQFGLGIANHRATLRELAANPVPPASQPVPPSAASEPVAAPPDEAAASRRSRIRK